MLGGICGHIISDDHLVSDILGVLQNRHQTGVSIVDLVIHRDHNGHLRVLHLREMQFSMFPVHGTNGKITVF